jgi:hypothetical protein
MSVEQIQNGMIWDSIKELDERLKKLEPKQPEKESGLEKIVTNIRWDIENERIFSNCEAVKQIREHIKKEIREKCCVYGIGNVRGYTQQSVEEVIDRS